MTIRAVTLAMFVALWAAPAACAEEAEGWKLMLQRNYEELQYQIDYVEGVSQSLPGMVKQTRQDLGALRKKLDELMVLARVSGSSPTELRAVLAGLEILQGRVEAVTQPFAKADTDLKHFQERLAEVETEFASHPPEGASQEVGKAMGDFLGDLRRLKGKLGRVKTVLDQGLNPTRDLSTGIGKLSQAISERIPRAWKDYYLAQGKSFLSVGAWQEAGQRLAGLPRLAGMYAGLFDTVESAPQNVLVKLLGLAAVLIAACAVALKRIERAFPGFRVTSPLASLSWMAFGVAIPWAASGPGFVLVRAETNALAEIILARGVLGLSMFLYRRRGDVPPGAVNPATWPWWMFALANVLQMPWIPEALRGGVWVVALLLAGWGARRAAARGGGDLVSRLASAGGWFLPLLVLPALLGWVNLTLLAGQAWFLMLVFLQAGLGLAHLTSRALDRPAVNLADEAAMSFGRGLAVPLTGIAMAAGFLFWLSMSMGGTSVFREVIDADLSTGGFSLDLIRLAAIWLTFNLARAGSRVAHRLVTEMPARRPNLERGVLNLLETMSSYLIWGLFVIVSMNMVGASFTSLAVVAGGLSVGIGFGMQNIINNFISGLILLFGRSVQAGDILQIGDIWGTVQRVNIRNTIVQTFDNATLFVPNSDLIAQKIINWSHKDRRIRRTLELGVAYGSDTSLVHSLLVRAASEHPQVLRKPGPGAQFIAFGDQALTFRLHFWVDDLDNAARVSSEIHMEVDRLLRENEVMVAAPRKP